MIYDHEGLEAKYDSIMRDIDEVTHELYSNHDHITPEHVESLHKALNILVEVRKDHGKKLDKWAEENA